MKCFWDIDGTCDHPRIKGVQATEERCRKCPYFSRASRTVDTDEKTAEDMKRDREAWEARRKDIREQEKQEALSLVEKAKSWVKAEVSQVLKGPVDDETYRQRLEACNACFRIERVEGAKLGFCTACGCGQNPRAELTVKAKMPESKCPIQAWGDPRAPRAPLPDTFRR